MQPYQDAPYPQQPAPQPVMLFEPARERSGGHTALLAVVLFLTLINSCLLVYVFLVVHGLASLVP